MTSAKPTFPEHQQAVRTIQRNNQVKIATPDLFVAAVTNKKENPEVIAALNFASATPGELINTTTSFLVNSPDVIYQPLKDIDKIKNTYDPAKILGLASGVSVSPGKQFAYDLQYYLPDSPVPNYYWTNNNLQIVIEFANLSNDQKVEVQFLSQGVKINDIIV